MTQTSRKKAGIDFEYFCVSRGVGRDPLGLFIHETAQKARQRKIENAHRIGGKGKKIAKIIFPINILQGVCLKRRAVLRLFLKHRIGVPQKKNGKIYLMFEGRGGYAMYRWVPSHLPKLPSVIYAFKF